MILENTTYIIASCVPVFSSITWILVLLFAWKDSVTEIESKLKGILLFYFIMVALGWTGMVIYTWFPLIFLYINPFSYIAFLCMQVQFYRFIHVITTLDGDEPFSGWHYFLPLSIGGIMLVWSLFIPKEVQVELTLMRGDIYEGYGIYSYFFLSKPSVHLVFCCIYTFLSFLRLRTYYKIVNHGTNMIYKPARWIIQLMTLVVTIFIISAIMCFLPRDMMSNSMVSFLLMIVLVLQHLVLVYNVIRRNILLYILVIPNSPIQKIKYTDMPVYRSCMLKTNFNRKLVNKPVARVLTKEIFEDYFNRYKPYLNPHLKITDLIEPLNANRSVLSGFINKTYGMNFNRYINRCRLKELERLSRLPANANKELAKLVRHAGFANNRNYIRALQAEQENEFE